MRQVSIRISMLRNMLMLVALFSIAVLATTVLGAREIAARLAEGLISQTIELTESRVQAFIDPFPAHLRIISQWAQEELLDSTNAAAAARLLPPLLAEYSHLSSVVLADDHGRSIQVGRQDEGYGLWQYDNIAAPGELHLSTWQSRFADRTLTSEERVYDARTRPWFLNRTVDELSWTWPYPFFSTQSPGMTVSIRTLDRNGNAIVIALDILLNEIDRFTRNMRPADDGMIIMTDGQGQIIGLPEHPRFADPETRNALFLKHPREIDWALAADAAKAFQPGADGTVQTVPVHFDSEGSTWWGQGKWINLDGGARLWVGAVVPEARLLRSLNRLRIWIVSATFLVTILAIIQAMVLSARYGVPIRLLAQESFRISRGDLEGQSQVRSQLLEVSSLAQAHDKMRLGLKVLLKLEDDLQAARQIQQSTLPDIIAQPSGYQIAARGRPADATGGDTFDAIGLRLGASGPTPSAQASVFPDVVTEDPDEVVLLLADASGHGVGPALAVTQVRAMVRMAARSAHPFDRLMQQLNNQLHNDLRSGRFITTWLARITAGADSIECISAGQAPIMHYQAKQGRWLEYGADSPPLGVLDELGPVEIRRIQMHPGDILIAASDGLYEARNNAGEDYGMKRTKALIQAQHEQSADEIIDTLFRDVEQFSEYHDNADDQTALIVKATASH